MPVELRHPPNVPGLLTIRDGLYYSVVPETLPPRLSTSYLASVLI